MGVASGRGQQEVGVASGWNLWVWLPCIGVVSGCCCIKEVQWNLIITVTLGPNLQLAVILRWPFY